MIVQLVRFRSGLPNEEVQRTIEERVPEYRDLPGLLEKYYIKDRETGEYGGVYIWDDDQSLRDFRTSKLARTIGDAYRAEGESKVETFEVIHVLRAQETAAVSS